MSDDENRKRMHQDDIDGAISSKRAALGSSSGASLSPPPAPEGDLLFKLLCPQSITGLIIGRKGSIINQLNVNTGARIRLSQNNEFFPGTSDRILLINGSKECIANAIRELVTRIAEAPEKKPNSGVPNVDMYGHPIPPANRGPQGTYQIKVLIPKTASAAIIGRKGAVIQRMVEQSNCKFQLGEEADPYNTRERIVIINSTTVANLVLGTETIMGQLLDDPRIRTYPILNANYAGAAYGMGGPGAPPSNFKPAGGNPGGIYPAPLGGPPPLLPMVNPMGYGAPGAFGMPPPGQFMGMPGYPAGGPPPMQVNMGHPLQHNAYSLMQQQYPLGSAMQNGGAPISYPNYGNMPLQQQPQQQGQQVGPQHDNSSYPPMMHNNIYSGHAAGQGAPAKK